MNVNQESLRRWVNFVLILAAFGMNVLANIAPLNDLTVGEIANTLLKDVLIIPANYAFAIWGLIYLGLISLAIYQVLPAQRNNPRLQQMGYHLAIASFSQIIWVFLFQFQFFALSLIAMLAILIPLILLYLRLDINLTNLSSSQRWLVNFPISIYLGWISVATIVNIASVLEIVDWSGWGISPLVWTVVMMIVSAIIAVIVIWQRKDTAFGGVFIWAFIAIAFKHEENPTLFIIGWLLAGILLIISITRKRVN